MCVSTYILQSEVLKVKVPDLQPNQQGCSKVQQLGPAGVTHVVRAFRGLTPPTAFRGLIPPTTASHLQKATLFCWPLCLSMLWVLLSLATWPGEHEEHQDVLLDHSWNFIWSSVPSRACERRCRVCSLAAGA